MKTILLTLLLLLCPRIYTQWFWQNPLPQGYSIFDVQFVSSNIAWAVGARGTILSSKNGGITWSTQNSNTLEALYSVFFLDTLVGYAAGYSGIVLKTSDGGVNWYEIFNSPLGQATEISFFNKDTGFVAGIQWGPTTNGYIYKTTDGGNSWNSNNFMLWTGDINCFNTNYAVAVGPDIGRSTNGGISWTFIYTPGSMRSVDFVDNNIGICVGDAGAIMKTTNSGASWVTLTSGTVNNLKKISYLDSLNAVAVGNGISLITTDGGESWLQQNNCPDLMSVSFADRYNGIAVGLNGRMLKTTDGGWVWNYISSGILTTFNSVSFADENIGSVVGQTGVILSTSNGGTNWELKPSGTVQNLSDVSYADNNNAIIVGDSGTILKTSDGGNSWNTLLSGTLNKLTSVSYVDEAFAVAVGYGIMLTTTNGGADWVSTSYPAYPVKLIDVSFIDHNNGLVTSNTGFVNRTTDGGLTWISNYVGPPAGVCLIDSLHASFLTDFKVWRTIDGGVTWFQQVLPISFDKALQDIAFSDVNNGMAVADSYNGLIFKTTNGGANWVHIFGTYYGGAGLNAISMISPDIVTVAGGLGTILHTHNGGVPVELSGFTYKVTGTEVKLYWSTRTETNNRIFEIERKYSGGEWITIGFVNGSGTTTETKEYSFTDAPALTGNYFYRLKQIDYNGSFKYSEILDLDFYYASQYLLQQNYPNPFNPSTTISYTIPENSNVVIKIFDILGNEIETLINEEQSAGSYDIKWSAAVHSSGLYFYQFRAGNYMETKKLILMK